MIETKIERRMYQLNLRRFSLLGDAFEGFEWMNSSQIAQYQSSPVFSSLEMMFNASA